MSPSHISSLTHMVSARQDRKYRGRSSTNPDVLSVDSGSRGPGFETRLCHLFFPYPMKLIGIARWPSSWHKSGVGRYSTALRKKCGWSHGRVNSLIIHHSLYPPSKPSEGISVIQLLSINRHLRLSAILDYPPTFVWSRWWRIIESRL